MDGLGSGPLTEAALQQHVRPLFSRVLAGERMYLANHSLGRPLDQMQTDVAEGTALWADAMRDAWAPWLAEEQRYRAVLAQLLGISRADLVVPRVSAGHALRSALNTLPQGARVLTTRGEFASVSVVLGQYAALGRIQLEVVEQSALCAAVEPELALVVVSHVFFASGRVYSGLEELAATCTRHGARLLVDCYHALGVLPFDYSSLGCDYLIGGCYKYLRGGPGVAFLALSPLVAAKVRPLDTGWFGAEPSSRGEPGLRPGGNGWLEGTPPVFTYYQARAGLALTAAVGVKRLRAYSLAQLGLLKDLLTEAGIASEGADEQHGAFLTVAHPDAAAIVASLNEQGIIVDAREGRVRLCPDILTTRSQLEQCARALVASIAHSARA